MEIRLSNQESEEMFFNSLCNGLGYIGGYGLELEYDDSAYEAARAYDPEVSPCFEDVLMRILKDGGELTLVDVECDGEYTRSISMQQVHERVEKTPARFLLDMVEERDDAETADVIIQTVFFEDIIFG
jgi:hypothetical protein